MSGPQHGDPGQPQPCVTGQRGLNDTGQPQPCDPGQPRPNITVQGLSRSFGAIRAVDGLDLTVPAGSIFGLLGPDGAGKSTLLRLLATVLVPDAGEAEVCGQPLTRPERITPRIGYMSQQTFLYPDLTVAENLDFFATLRGVPRAERRRRADSLLASMGMAEFRKRAFGKLSGGMKQKAMLATTLMHSPELLLLDEPTTGVDPVSRREFWHILAGLHDPTHEGGGRTVVVATPYLDEAERCTDIAFMLAGKLTHHGTPAEIKARVPGFDHLDAQHATMEAAFAWLADPARGVESGAGSGVGAAVGVSTP